MEHIDELLGLLDLEAMGADTYRGEHPDTMLQRTFGGQVLAQSLAAVYRTLPPERLAHSLTSWFLRPGSTRHPIDYRVQRTRDGDSFSNRRVTASQDGVEIFVMSASFKVWETGLEHAVDPLESPTLPEECPSLAQVLGARSRSTSKAWEKEWAALDTRFVSQTPLEPGGARMQMWWRSNGALPDDPRIHQMVLAYASDLTLLAVSTLPHPGAFGSPKLQMATIDHSMWFHRPIRADEWVLYEQESPSAANALGLSFGRLFSSTGALGASTAQEGLVRLTDGRERRGLV